MTTYNLMCPKCRSTSMLIRGEDLDEDGEFYDSANTIVGCLSCGHMAPVLSWMLVETSDDGVMHIMVAS